MALCRCHRSIVSAHCFILIHVLQKGKPNFPSLLLLYAKVCETCILCGHTLSSDQGIIYFGLHRLSKNDSDARLIRKIRNRSNDFHDWGRMPMKTTISREINANIHMFHQLLHVDENFDILSRVVEIAGKTSCLYLIDGLNI